jgi:uncharacterized protein YdiU (UPF0061 family)
VPSFSSRFTRALPGDPSELNVPRQVSGALWSKALPTPVSNPTLLAFSPEVAQLLGVTEGELRALLPVLAGNAPPPGVEPFAANYGGHQFGHWAGQLGDGRAIGLGELSGLELQLKGAGPTPYSRRGDGRAVLRSSIREFLCSEAMHHLGVPTTRALSLVLTGDTVVRDLFYDGHPEPEPGAIVCRVAPSFLRFGSFELCTAREDHALLQRLVDYTLTLFPLPQGASLGPLPIGVAPQGASLPLPIGVAPQGASLTPAQLLLEVARRTAVLVAHWQAVGFVHGVMNTDNMSVLGLTIDYGPYGWVDDFDPNWTPNTTDAHHRRYRFGNQPEVGLWNLERLGVALLPLLEGGEDDVLEALREYQRVFSNAVSQRFADKLGLPPSTPTAALTERLMAWLGAHETDFTLFFRALSSVVGAPEPTTFPAALHDAFYREPPPEHLARGLTWVRDWWQAARSTTTAPTELAARLNRVNPKYVLRNWLSQVAIDAAHQGDASEVVTLLDVMRRPFDEQPGRERFAQKRPEWARSKPGCSALSCSS